jgi:hypothetical protein
VFHPKRNFAGYATLGIIGSDDGHAERRYGPLNASKTVSAAGARMFVVNQSRLSV